MEEPTTGSAATGGERTEMRWGATKTGGAKPPPLLLEVTAGRRIEEAPPRIEGAPPRIEGATANRESAAADRGSSAAEPTLLVPVASAAVEAVAMPRR
jgi:hypothetical protein